MAACSSCNAARERERNRGPIELLARPRSAPIKYFEHIEHGVYNPDTLDERIALMPYLPKPCKPKLSLLVLAGLATLCLNATAQQVYESTDEQGNVTFSDTPTPGSRTVTIEAPNLGDAVKVPPPSPDTETQEAPKPKAPAASGEVPPELSTTDNDAVDVEGDDWVYRNRLYDKDRYERRRHRTWYPHPEPRGGR